MRSLALLLLLVAASIGASRDDTTSLVPASAVADPLPIRVPPTGVAPGPVQPFPTAALKLTPETICVIDSDVSVRVLASPSGFVRVVRDTGPLRVRGRFIDGNGRTETRNLQGKFLYFVEPAANGRVELLVIPTGEAKTDDSDVIRRTIDVQAGDGPQPPPPDPKPPEPDPTNPAPIPEPGLRVLIVYDFSTASSLPPAQDAILRSQKLWDFAREHCVKGPDGKTPEMRIYHSQVNTANETELWKKAWARPRKSLPWILVSNGKTGFEGPLPENVDKTIELISKYKVD